MKTAIFILPFVILAAGCQMSQTDRSTLTGAATGAALGAAVAGDDDRVRGAVIGGAAGAVAGNLVGRANSPGDCIYRDQNGNRYVAECP